MRITNRLISDGVVQDLPASAARLNEAQRQLTSGKQLNRPSDNPSGTSLDLSLRADVSARDARVASTSDALDWLGTTDNAMASATDLVRHAQDLALQGANDGVNDQQRKDLATDVNETLSQLIQVANTNLRGNRIFPGQHTDTDPFVAVGDPPSSVTWQGDSGVMQREIDTNTTIGVNVVGEPVFAPVFDRLIQLRDALNNGDVAGIRSAGLDGMSQQLDALLSVRASVGTKVTRLESLQNVQAMGKQQSTSSLSTVEDTDYTQAVTALTLRQTAYNAALATSARSVPQSLFDFLH